MDKPFHARNISLIKATFFLLAILPLFLTKSMGDEPTAYEILERYNFPIGILPKGVTGYDLEESTGKFSAYLNGSCSFSIEGSYKLSYQPTIKGYISQGKLSSLQGIKVKWLFLWFDIIEVYRNGDVLEFSFGIASGEFSIDNFEECPECGCGFSCSSNPFSSKTRRNEFGICSY
ncbi:uncharacterized protein At5g01610-like [Coffea arabica]|uniref:Uncharacterized protein At5g01610-like n=1 Tax=Coffea arabica TaxID=13443 RepID=A0ABM4WQA6_COFAR